MAERPYYVQNIVGDARTRTHRANATRTQRNKIFILGQRILPGGKIPLTRDAFEKVATQLMELVLEGKLILTTPEGMKITSRWTGEFILTRADGAVKMLAKGEIPGCFPPPEDWKAVRIEPFMQPVVKEEVLPTPLNHVEVSVADTLDTESGVDLAAEPSWTPQPSDDRPGLFPVDQPLVEYPDEVMTGDEPVKKSKKRKKE